MIISPWSSARTVDRKTQYPSRAQQHYRIVYRGDVRPRALVFCAILTWERRFDKWSFFGSALARPIRSQTLVKTLAEHTSAVYATETDDNGKSRAIIGQSHRAALRRNIIHGHTRRLIPMAKSDIFFFFPKIFFRTCAIVALYVGFIIMF